MSKSRFTILLLFYHCIHADVNPPNPDSLNRVVPRVQIQARIQPLDKILIRYWDAGLLLNLPFTANHHADGFGVYLNSLSVSPGSERFSIWLFVDQDEDSSINSSDQVYVQINRAIPPSEKKVILKFGQSSLMNLASVEPSGVLPPQAGSYYCFFKPTRVEGESILLNEGVSFSEWNPYVSWEKASVPSAQNLKKAYLPVEPMNNKFTGKCILDQNQDEKFNMNELTFDVPEFQVLSGVSNFFTIPIP